jgi:hypothetical protein
LAKGLGQVLFLLGAPGSLAFSMFALKRDKRKTPAALAALLSAILCIWLVYLILQKSGF